MKMKPDPFNILPRETFPGLTSPVRQNRAVMNLDFAHLVGHSPALAENGLSIPTEMIRRPPLPDGTGQIINIGI